MKKTIIGYIPAAITFGSVPGMILVVGLCSALGLCNLGYQEFCVGPYCILITAILSFSIGTILNLAFLAYAGFTGRLMELYSYGSTSEGIVSKGGAVTATITLLIQFYVIITLLLSR